MKTDQKACKAKECARKIHALRKMVLYFPCEL
jgi:hypothetical protein